MGKKIAVLMVNLGTPDSPKNSDVRKYLNQFLTDGRVIDFPWIARQLLVRGIITPFRTGNSATTYRAIWDDKTGSPLLHYSETLVNKVGAILETDSENEYKVELAMRYKNPSIESSLKKLRDWKPDSYIIFPLFPHYASATTGSVHQNVMEIMSKWWEIPDVRFINSYYDNPEMIKVFAENGSKHGLENYEHILFSFHGLPQRHLRKATKDSGNNYCLQKKGCCETICEANKHCYSSQSHQTAYLIAEHLNIPKEKYTICFQSRLGRDPWQTPYTSEVLKELAAKGVKKVLVFCPAFVADCLETVFEISEEYQEEFEEAGGEHVQLAESLNDHPDWVNAVVKMIKTS